jgi:prephenate dehydrogenase
MSVLLPSLAIVGVGLIGGSLSLALQAKQAVGRVLGVGRSAKSLQQALDLGLIHEAGSLEQAAQADVVLLATPVAQIPAILQTLAQHIAPHTVITDAGSTKDDVVTAARQALGSKFKQFVPAHPIAGTENSGPSAAFAALYQQRKVVLTPLPETDARAVALVQTMWQTAGANTRLLSPEAHDRIFAAVSHLPHLLAFALVEQLAESIEANDYFDYAASGFRDFTRIAGSSPEMWRDIFFANREALLAHLDQYQTQLNSLRDLLTQTDSTELLKKLSTASRARRHWQAQIERGESFNIAHIDRAD